MKLHHTGYITGNILETAKAFEVFGYVKDATFDDTIQKCHICFLKRGGTEPMIELVQPYEDNKSMQKMLTKRGVSPYHLCYEVEDIQATYDVLSETEGWLPIFAPVQAVAFDNRKIAYFMNAETGYIEFVNREPESGGGKLLIINILNNYRLAI